MRGINRKKTAGFSLIELLIAIGLLAIITVPILSMFVTSTRMTANAYRTTLATFAAQMRVEECIGLTPAEIADMASDPDDNGRQDGSFWVTAEVVEEYEGFPNLAEVTVNVYDSEAKESLYCTQTAVVYVDTEGAGP